MNTPKPTTASTARGDAGVGATAIDLRRFDLERLAVVPQLELPVGVGAAERRRELGGRDEARDRMDPEVDHHVLVADEPGTDDLHLRRRRHAADVVPLAIPILLADELGVLQPGEQRSPPELRIEERRRVEVVAGGERLEHAGHRVRQPNRVVDRDRTELGLE
jgi:hypothetical protein